MGILLYTQPFFTIVLHCFNFLKWDIGIEMGHWLAHVKQIDAKEAITEFQQREW